MVRQGPSSNYARKNLVQREEILTEEIAYSTKIKAKVSTTSSEKTALSVYQSWCTKAYLPNIQSPAESKHMPDWNITDLGHNPTGTITRPLRKF